MLKQIYDKIITSLAGGEVIRRPDIPGIELGIGPAEILAPVYHPYMLPSPSMFVKPQVAKIKTMEDLKNVGSGAKISPEDFPHSGYIGEAL